MTEGPSLTRWARQVAAIVAAGIVLVACRVVESLRLDEDGSGSMRAELFLEASELQLASDVRAKIKQDLERDSKKRLVFDGPRDGGHLFAVEQIFEDVRELGGKDASYRWSVAENGIFSTRFTLEMNTSLLDSGGPQISAHRLEVSLPGRVVETNGEEIGRGRVAWDRLTGAGTGFLSVSTEKWQLPSPSRFATGVSERLEPRLFDDSTLALARKDGVWLRSVSSGKESRVVGLDGGVSLSAGGSTIAVTNEGEVKVLRIDGTGRSLEISGVAPYSVQVAPDGQRVAFLRARPGDADMSSGGLFLFDVETGTEELLGGAIEVPRTLKRRNRNLTNSEWWGDAFKWSSDSRSLLLTRWHSNQEVASYYIDLGEKEWKLVGCEGAHATSSSAFTGRKLVFVQALDSRVCDLETGALLPGPPLPMSAGLGAAYTPDGSTLAYPDFGFLRNGDSLAMGGDEAARGIWVLGTEGGSARKLISGHPESTAALSWNKSGRWLLAQVSSDLGGASRVLAIDSVSGRIEEIAQNRAVSDLHWVRAPRNPALTVGRIRLAASVVYWTVLALVLATAAFITIKVARKFRRAGREEPGRTRRVCGQCGSPLAKGARFCAKCGGSAREGEISAGASPQA